MLATLIGQDSRATASDRYDVSNVTLGFKSHTERACELDPIAEPRHLVFRITSMRECGASRAMDSWPLKHLTGSCPKRPVPALRVTGGLLVCSGKLLSRSCYAERSLFQMIKIYHHQRALHAISCLSTGFEVEI